MDALIPINQPAPLFELPDLEGRIHALRDYRGRIVILNFWSAECPWVERADQALQPLLREWGEQVVYLPIAANPNESLEEIQQAARQRGLGVVLLDPEQRAVEAYGAQTTPHFFVIDGTGVLRYQGALDDITFRQRAPRQAYLANAVAAILVGELPRYAQTNPYGCAIVAKTAL